MKSAGKKEWRRRMHIGHAHRKQGTATRSALTEMNENKHREGIKSARSPRTQDQQKQRKQCKARQATERETINAKLAKHKYTKQANKPRAHPKQKLMQTKVSEKQLFEI